MSEPIEEASIRQCAMSHYRDVRQAVCIMGIPDEAGEWYARVKARELYGLLRDSRQ